MNISRVRGGQFFELFHDDPLRVAREQVVFDLGIFQRTEADLQLPVLGVLNLLLDSRAYLAGTQVFAACVLDDRDDISSIVAFFGREIVLALPQLQETVGDDIFGDRPVANIGVGEQPVRFDVGKK